MKKKKASQTQHHGAYGTKLPPPTRTRYCKKMSFSLPWSKSRLFIYLRGPHQHGNLQALALGIPPICSTKRQEPGRTPGADSHVGTSFKAPAAEEQRANIPSLESPPGCSIDSVFPNSWSLMFFLMGFPGGISGKESTCQCRRSKRHEFDPWVGKTPWGRAWQPTPVFLPGEAHGQRGLLGYSPQGRTELDMTEAT